MIFMGNTPWADLCGQLIPRPLNDMKLRRSMDMTSAECEYPLSLDNTPPPCPSPSDHEDQSEQPIYENVVSSNGQLLPIADGSDSGYSEVEHDARIRIHSKKKERPHNGSVCWKIPYRSSALFSDTFSGFRGLILNPKIWNYC